MTESKNLKLTAYNALKTKILYNELKPGEYLEEKMLCDMLGISRTPIREAVGLLAQENLVRILPRRGIFVTDITIQSAKELFEARHLLEPIALKLAFNNFDLDKLLEYRDRFSKGLEVNDLTTLHQLDYEFHNYITSCCRNEFIVKTVNNLSDNFQRVRTQDFFSKVRISTGAQEHIQLIDLFIKGDLKKSLSLLQTHISYTENYYFKSLIQ